jgi:ATP-dependent DNA helicase RecG
MLSEQELHSLFRDLESDRVERKRSPADRSKIRRAICAFSNDLPSHGKPGVIFVGVNDDGSCAHQELSPADFDLLAQMRSDGSILPPPSMSLQRIIVDGCTVVAIVVAPAADPPARYEGRVWVRVGATAQLATAEDERRLAERRRAHDLSFDLRPAPDAGTDELDLEWFRHEYLPQAVAADILERNTRPLEQQLASLRFVTRGMPNYGALICFGRDPLRWVPGATVQFLRLDGDTVDSPIRDQKRLSGPLHDTLKRLDEILEINISVRTDLLSGATEVRQPDYPVVALQQLARNALMHRAYDGTNAPTRITWFSDRIEIQNPGGLFGQVNRENFGTGVTDYRNPVIAEFMSALGYVQRFGFGIPLARDQLEKNGNPPPVFEFQPGSVLVTIRPAP